MRVVFQIFNKTFELPDVGQGKLVAIIKGEINDAQLSDAFINMQEQLDRMKELNIQITKWLGEFTGVSDLQGKKNKSLMIRRLKKIVLNGPDGGPQGPVWVLQPGFQELVNEFKINS